MAGIERIKRHVARMNQELRDLVSVEVGCDVRKIPEHQDIVAADHVKIDLTKDLFSVTWWNEGDEVDDRRMISYNIEGM